MATDVNLFLDNIFGGDNDKKKEEEKKKKEEQAKKKDSAMRGVVVESTATAAPQIKDTALPSDDGLSDSQSAKKLLDDLFADLDKPVEPAVEYKPIETQKAPAIAAVDLEKQLAGTGFTVKTKRGLRGQTVEITSPTGNTKDFLTQDYTVSATAFGPGASYTNDIEEMNSFVNSEMLTKSANESRKQEEDDLKQNITEYLEKAKDSGDIINYDYFLPEMYGGSATALSQENYGNVTFDSVLKDFKNSEEYKNSQYVNEFKLEDLFITQTKTLADIDKQELNTELLVRQDNAVKLTDDQLLANKEKELQGTRNILDREYVDLVVEIESLKGKTDPESLQKLEQLQERQKNLVENEVKIPSFFDLFKVNPATAGSTYLAALYTKATSKVGEEAKMLYDLDGNLLIDTDQDAVSTSDAGVSASKYAGSDQDFITNEYNRNLVNWGKSDILGSEKINVRINQEYVPFAFNKYKEKELGVYSVPLKELAKYRNKLFLGDKNLFEVIQDLTSAKQRFENEGIIPEGEFISNEEELFQLVDTYARQRKEIISDATALESMRYGFDPATLGDDSLNFTMDVTKEVVDNFKKSFVKTEDLDKPIKTTIQVKQQLAETIPNDLQELGISEEYIKTLKPSLAVGALQGVAGMSEDLVEFALFDIAATAGEGAVVKLATKMPKITAALKGSKLVYNDKFRISPKDLYVLAKEEAKMRTVFDENYHFGGGVAFAGMGMLSKKYFPLNFGANRLNTLMGVPKEGVIFATSSELAKFTEGGFTTLKGGKTFKRHLEENYSDFDEVSREYLGNIMFGSLLNIKGLSTTAVKRLYKGEAQYEWMKTEAIDKLNKDAQDNIKSISAEIKERTELGDKAEDLKPLEDNLIKNWNVWNTTRFIQTNLRDLQDLRSGDVERVTKWYKKYQKENVETLRKVSGNDAAQIIYSTDATRFQPGEQAKYTSDGNIELNIKAIAAKKEAADPNLVSHEMTHAITERISKNNPLFLKNFYNKLESEFPELIANIKEQYKEEIEKDPSILEKEFISFVAQRLGNKEFYNNFSVVSEGETTFFQRIANWTKSFNKENVGFDPSIASKKDLVKFWANLSIKLNKNTLTAADLKRLEQLGLSSEYEVPVESNAEAKDFKAKDLGTDLEKARDLLEVYRGIKAADTPLAKRAMEIRATNPAVAEKMLADSKDKAFGELIVSFEPMVNKEAGRINTQYGISREEAVAEVQINAIDLINTYKPYLAIIENGKSVSIAEKGVKMKNIIERVNAGEISFDLNKPNPVDLAGYISRNLPLRTNAIYAKYTEANKGGELFKTTSIDEIRELSADDVAGYAGGSAMESTAKANTRLIEAVDALIPDPVKRSDYNQGVLDLMTEENITDFGYPAVKGTNPEAIMDAMSGGNLVVKPNGKINKAKTFANIREWLRKDNNASLIYKYFPLGAKKQAEGLKSATKIAKSILNNFYEKGERATMLEGTAAGLAVQEKVPFDRNDFLEKVGAIGSKDRNKDTLLEAIINEVDRSTTNRVVRKELEIQGKEDKLLQELADGKSEDLLAKELDPEFDNLRIQLAANLAVDNIVLKAFDEVLIDAKMDDAIFKKFASLKGEEKTAAQEKYLNEFAKPFVALMPNEFKQVLTSPSGKLLNTFLEKYLLYGNKGRGAGDMGRKGGPGFQKQLRDFYEEAGKDTQFENLIDPKSETYDVEVAEAWNAIKGNLEAFEATTSTQINKYNFAGGKVFEIAGKSKNPVKAGKEIVAELDRIYGEGKGVKTYEKLGKLTQDVDFFMQLMLKKWYESVPENKKEEAKENLYLLKTGTTNILESDRIFAPLRYIQVGVKKSYLEHIVSSLEVSTANYMDIINGTFSKESFDAVRGLYYTAAIKPSSAKLLDKVWGSTTKVALNRFFADPELARNTIDLYAPTKNNTQFRTVEENLNAIYGKPFVKKQFAIAKEAKSLYEKSMDLSSKDLSKDPMSDLESIARMSNVDVAHDLARIRNKKNKGISVFDFDDTLARSKSNVLYTMPDGRKGKLNAEEFAKRGDELLAQGAVYDFSEFKKVMQGSKGPLFELAKQRGEKFTTKDVFVLTARPPESAVAIQKFLKESGLDIPLENITGLGNSSAQAKADWIVNKAAEGYNDFYFADDAVQNVKAVKDALSVLDVKSDVQQAFAAKDLNKEFNKLVASKLGIAPSKNISKARAEMLGRKKKGTWFIPYSNEDFMGLMYPLLGKGKKGDADVEFIKEALVRPFERGEYNISKERATLARDMLALKDQTKKLNPGTTKKLKNTVDEAFTAEHAVRVYIWGRQGMEVPGLNKKDIRKLTNYVKADKDLVEYAENLMLLGKSSKYPEPTKYWAGGNISNDFRNSLLTTRRKYHLAEWIQNKNEIFTPEMYNKLEATFGKGYVDALKESLAAMERGKNRLPSKNKQFDKYLDFINGSVGAVMFLNTKSAVLQTLSTLNYLNWTDNNPVAAAKQFANIPKFSKTFMELFNSEYLVNRRDGLKINVSEAELNDVFKDRNKVEAFFNLMIRKGFTPTRYADSFAIALGGSSFYLNRIETYKKNGLSEAEAKKEAFVDFMETSEQSQQSSRTDKISQEQRGHLGRLILSFANTPIQYNRLMKKAIMDIRNGRGDVKTNVSKILYYGAAQNIIFSTLQSALFGMFFDPNMDEEDKMEKYVKVVNSTSDSFLRGLGVAGATAAMLKNVGIKIYQEHQKPRAEYDKAALEVLSISPPLDSKITKLTQAGRIFKYEMDAIQEEGWSLNNPAWQAGAKVFAAGTNVGVDRFFVFKEQYENLMDDNLAMWKRIAAAGGWQNYELDIEKDEKRLPLKKPYNPFKIRLKDATKPKINLDLNIKLNY